MSLLKALPKQPPGSTRGRLGAVSQVVSLLQHTLHVASQLRHDFDSTTDKQSRTKIAVAMSNLGKSWCALQDAKREIQGRPRAGSLRPDKPKSKRKPIGLIVPIRESLSDPPNSPVPRGTSQSPDSADPSVPNGS